jgi:hypothetical protein
MYYNLYIKKTTNNIIKLSSLIEDEFSISSNQVVISGLTNNRLDEIKDFNNNIVLNINGVTVLNENFVIYELNNIQYKTIFDENLTTTFYIFALSVFYNNIIFFDEYQIINDLKINNKLNIDRNNISIFNYFNNINNSKTLNEILELF